MVERIPVYRYVVEREGQAPELHWTLAPLRYVSDDDISDTRSFGTMPTEAGLPEPVGHIEALDGTTVVCLEPPVLEVPGHGRIALAVAIDAGDETSDLSRVLCWQPAEQTFLSRGSSS